MQERRPELESSALPQGKRRVEQVDGLESLNALYRYRLRLHSKGSPLLDDMGEELMRSEVSLVFRLAEQEVRRIFGIVSAVDVESDANDGASVVDVELVPRMWLLTQRHGNRLFVSRSVPEVIAEVLAGIGLEQGNDFVMALEERYAVRELVVQYDETDLAFVSRLCEHLGIIWFFEHREGRDVVIFTDTQNAFSAISGDSRITVRDRRNHPAAYAVRTSLRRSPAEIVVHDYNYRAPRLPLSQAADTARPIAQGSLVEYGAHTKTSEETMRLATVRRQELAAEHALIRGVLTDERASAGSLFTLVDTDGSERELLVTRLEYRFRDPKEDDVESAWDIAFTALDRAAPYRPARNTPRPKVPGLVNAIVDGAINGPYAELDDAGRYHLRMLYDRSGRTDLSATHPVRMMQPHAGPHYGMHFPLRPGTEVLVGFVNGDPDRPVIVGTAPNPEIASPVDRANQTQNVLRTGSSNELVIEDEHGRERIRLHTPHQLTTIQLGSEQEAEVGALTLTQAHITEASRLSNNEATARKTLVADTSTALLGKTAVWWVGSDALSASSALGLNEPSSLRLGSIASEIGRLTVPPGELADEESPEALADDGTAGGSLFSQLGADISQAADEAAHALVRSVAEFTDRSLDDAIGRQQGEPLGTPLAPSAIVGSAKTAALMARDRALVFGERAVSLSSFDTAAIAGERVALVKSPKAVEVAAGEELKLTTAGELDVAANLLRIVAGYYPDAEAPPLDEGTSLGVMSRHDLRVLSVEDCILLCAHKNLIGSAHTGDIRLTAAEAVTIRGASISGSAGHISLSSGGDLVAKADGDLSVDVGGDTDVSSGGDISIEAGGVVTIKGSDVTIEGGTITLKGNTKVQGDLLVTGSIKGG